MTSRAPSPTGTPVGPGVEVKVGVGVLVDVGVGVFVGVLVFVGVNVGVFVGVEVGVALGVKVGVSVGVGMKTLHWLDVKTSNNNNITNPDERRLFLTASSPTTDAKNF